MLKRLFCAAVLFGAVISPSLAASKACPEKFIGGEPPKITNERLATRAYELCFQGFAVLSSGITKTPLWSAEHLTRGNIESARHQERVNIFHEESRLPFADRATLDDYKRSGFDRGHMSPSGDMPDAASQAESFSLANMIPQNPNNNRGLWEGVESAVRDLASEDGEIYVVTGPIFRGATLQRLNGRVVIPTNIFKAVYNPRRRGAGVYLVDNAPGMAWQTISISELRGLTGLDVFPGLSQTVKDRAMELPAPTPHSHHRRKQ